MQNDECRMMNEGRRRICLSSHSAFTIHHSAFRVHSMLDDLLSRVPTFVLVFFRLAGMMAFAPLFGSTRIPRQVKVLLVLVLTFGMFQGVARPALPDSMWELAVG